MTKQYAKFILTSIYFHIEYLMIGELLQNTHPVWSSAYMSCVKIKIVCGFPPPSCTGTEYGLRLDISNLGSRGIVLSK